MLQEEKDISLEEIEKISKKIEKVLDGIKTDKEYEKYLNSLGGFADIFDKWAGSSADKLHYNQKNPDVKELLNYFK